MTRETKLSILIGVSLVLVVAILISDHFSTANNAELASTDSTISDPASDLAVDSFEMKAPTVIVQGDDGRFRPIDQINATNESVEPEQSTLGQLASNLQTEFNHLRENGLTPAAETVSVPALEMGKTQPKPAPAETKPKATTPRAERSHTVTEDDTLWGIASRYYGSGTLHADIRKYNRLSVNQALTIGMKLRIPDRAALGKPAPKKQPQNTPTPKTAEGHKLYTVQSGDTLSEIAHRELGAVSRMYDIQDAQGRTIDPEEFVLRVGITLRLPAN